MSPEEAALARQALRSAEGCARRLARSQGKLAAQFPLSPARVTALPPDVEDDLDAFLKRYEQLVNAIRDELFTVVAIVGGEDVRGLARREVAELMDRLGALPSAASFRLLVAIRNRMPPESGEAPALSSRCHISLRVRKSPHVSADLAGGFRQLSPEVKGRVEATSTQRVSEGFRARGLRG